MSPGWSAPVLASTTSMAFFEGVLPVVLIGDYLNIAATNPDYDTMTFPMTAGPNGWSCVAGEDLIVETWLGARADMTLLLVQTLIGSDATIGRWADATFRLPAVQMFETVCDLYREDGLVRGPIGCGSGTNVDSKQLKQLADDFVRSGGLWLSPGQVGA